MYTLPVDRSFTGWFAPLCPYFIFSVLPPFARAISWCPRQIPKIGMSPSKSFLSSSIISVHSAGSPGPLLSIIPSGLSLNISSALVFSGYTVTSQPLLKSESTMFFFAPKSISAILYFVSVIKSFLNWNSGLNTLSGLLAKRGSNISFSLQDTRSTTPSTL